MVTHNPSADPNRRRDLKELLPLQAPAVLGFETSGVVEAIGGDLGGSVVGRSHS